MLVTGAYFNVDFENVLSCLFFTIKRLDSSFWLDRGDEYPQLVFATIKDNPSYTRLLESPAAGETLPWFLTGLFDYVWSIWTVPRFDEVLAKMITFLCDELQHERFKDTWPLTMTAAAKVIP